MPSTQLSPGSSSAQLADRLIQALFENPAQKADELALELEENPTEVLKCLAVLQGITVRQDRTYRWSLLASGPPVTLESTPQPNAEITRLCQYYLNCLETDSDAGVSVPASGLDGAPPAYAELPGHPLVRTQDAWETLPLVRQILSRVSGNARTAEAWVGYPVSLRKQDTGPKPGWFIEPLLLWKVVLSPETGLPTGIEAGLPQLNFSFLRDAAMGGPSEVVEEAASLGTELGLNNRIGDQPSTEELLLRLRSLRPDWAWMESLEPEACSAEDPLAVITEPGIYNRAVVVPAKRSPYTLGLESELKDLSRTHPVDFLGTALDQWVHGQLVEAYAREREHLSAPLMEVLPMNAEQRAAVRSALTSPLTVVTGPPGTGKSQVVTNLIVNAAWQGMKVLFASKNNKAVDVVEARVNGLGVRPVLLRLGSADYQNKLASYFSSMVSGTAGPQDLRGYEDKLAQQAKLLKQAEVLDRLQAQTMASRNEVGRLEADIHEYRHGLGQPRFNQVTPELIEAGQAELLAFEQALARYDPEHAHLFSRLFSRLFRAARTRELGTALAALAPTAEAVCPVELTDMEDVDCELLREFARAVAASLSSGEVALTYRSALEALLMSPPLEAIAQQKTDLTEQMAQHSAELWRDWVQLLPTRLSEAERKDVAVYASLLQVLNDPSTRAVSQATRQRAFELQQRVTPLFSSWAVTSLSVRGRVPLEPGYFDLVVIDEASQCDIASAIPLLYRAKRAVVIGDPLQLRHISALSPSRDLELQQRYGLAPARESWLYSVNSLYDLAASVASRANVISLRDHHRSHADIIEFSNKTFYAGQLRVATRHAALTLVPGQTSGVSWTEAAGTCVRPPSGGLANVDEAHAVVAMLENLLVHQGYTGTVGVVTPFRAQANLLQRLVSRSPGLSKVGARCNLAVDTVHRFQGDERDVMVFSPVISTPTPGSAVTFLRNNPNLFNVAITRARAHLHVVGDSLAAQHCGVEYLEAFSRYAHSLAAPSGLVALAEAGPLDHGPSYPPTKSTTGVLDTERTLYRALYAQGLRPQPKYVVEHHEVSLAIFEGDRKLALIIDSERYGRDWDTDTCLRDQLRTQRLVELGWQVKRLWAYELQDRPADCVEFVMAWVGA